MLVKSAAPMAHLHRTSAILRWKNSDGGHFTLFAHRLPDRQLSGRANADVIVGDRAPEMRRTAARQHMSVLAVGPDKPARPVDRQRCIIGTKADGIGLFADGHGTSGDGG